MRSKYNVLKHIKHLYLLKLLKKKNLYCKIIKNTLHNNKSFVNIIKHIVFSELLL